MENLIFDIKRFAINDGPGIRVTVFFKGCPLSCKWCHNPESISPQPQKMYDKNKCIGCEACVKACDLNACVLTKDGIVTDLAVCKACDKCEDACPTKATEISGKIITEDNLMTIIKKETLLMDMSDGGVTFSGGEPLMHYDFLMSILNRCKSEGIHTCIDTTGFIKTEKLLKIAEKSDCFLYDLKMMNSTKHKYYTGVDNKLILSNLRELAKTDAEIFIRIPLIKSVNDDIENITESAKFISELRNKSIRVNILPYHNIAGKKYEKLGGQYDEGKMSEPEDVIINEFIDVFKSYGIKAVVGG